MDENQTQQSTLETPQQAEQTAGQTPMSAGSPRRRTRGGGKSKAIIIVIILLFLVGGGLLYLGRRKSSSEAEPSPSPELFGVISSPEPSESTPTPAPANREDVSISILNGTGIGGEAGLLQGELEDLGYSDIEVGNADDQDNQTTVVTFADDLDEAIVDEITEELESIYEEVDVETSASLTVDVQIITGLRKGQTFPPEPTEAPQATDEPEESPSPTPTNPSNITN